MVSTKYFTTLLLGLFTTCFILVAAFHLSHENVHRVGLPDADTDVSSLEGVFTRVGEKKFLFGERKFLRDIKALVEESSYKINEDSKSSGKSSSYKPSDCSISQLNFKVKIADVGVSKSSSSSQIEPISSESQDNSFKAQKFHNAATQVVNFLHKDYGGIDMPKRKPPVHNGEPFH